jgi:hypothetical protein
MKYLTSYKESINYDDDAYTMARYQLFNASTTISFYFNNESFTDRKDIKILIKKYNEFYIKENSWIGGPQPNGFIKFFNKNYSKLKSDRTTFYPTINLEIDTLDMGKLIIGFSLITKKCMLFNWKHLSKLTNYDFNYDQRVKSEIVNYFRNEIQPLNINEVIKLLSLEITNPVDWKWQKNLDL